MQKIEKQLRSGNSIEFESDDHMLEATFDSSNGWRGGFKIWFNGTYVHTSKTYKSFERKLNQLVRDYSLQPVGV